MTAFVEATAGMVVPSLKNILIKIWLFLLISRYLALVMIIIKYHAHYLIFRLSGQKIDLSLTMKLNLFFHSHYFVLTACSES